MLRKMGTDRDVAGVFKKRTWRRGVARSRVRAAAVRRIYSGHTYTPRCVAQFQIFKKCGKFWASKFMR